MVTILTLALPFSLVFMTLSNELTWQGFVVGYIVSVIVLQLGQAYNLNIRSHRVFPQAWYLLLYSFRLAVDIFLSSVQVARMVLSPNMGIDPGIIKISTQDEQNNDIVTAMSSHGITITPGQIVSDIEKTETETFMYVHNLNVSRSGPTIEAEQTARLRLIRKVLGYDG